MNIPLLTKNLATPPMGAAPALDITADLAHKRGYTLNSWFVIGHFESEGRTLNYLVHLFALSIGGITVGVDSAASITDETTGWYGVQHGFHPIFRTHVRSDKLLVKTPHSSLSGTLDEMHVRAQIKGASIDVALKAVGHPLYKQGHGTVRHAGHGRLSVFHPDAGDHGAPDHRRSGIPGIGHELVRPAMAEPAAGPAARQMDVDGSQPQQRLADQPLGCDGR